MGEVFGDLLDRFIAGKEVEHLIDVSSEDVYASEFFNQLGLERVPIRDVVEGTSFGEGDGLESESHFNNITSLSQLESVQNGR
jgi:hypothetical protein